MKKNRDTIFRKKCDQTDRTVKDALTGICEHIEASDSLKQQIDSRIEGISVKEEYCMKHISIKKVVIGVAAACLVVGTVCIAGSGIRMYKGGTSSIPNYTKFEDLNKAEGEVGYEIKAVSSFYNQFAMEGIHIGDLAVQNEAGQTEAAEKEINIEYQKNGESIMFGARKIFDMENAEEMMRERTPDKTLQAGETKVVFTETTNKFVPPDYELTDEDKANMEKEDFNLAYGSSEVKINKGYHVMWIEDGIVYTLYGADLSISPEEMLGMAKEVIESAE